MRKEFSYSMDEEIVCPTCFSHEVQKRGYNTNGTKRRISCNSCGEWNSVLIVEKDLKVGVIDIEMLPAVFYSWGARDQYLSSDQMIYDTTFLSWAGKYLNSGYVSSDIMTSKEAIERDPFRIVKSAHDFIKTCSIVIGHNWKNFDGKILNTFFLRYGLDTLRYETVDTLMVARDNFRFTSNKLADINKSLGIRNKISNDGFPLWIKCSNGDSKALEEMLHYNIGDILSTEELYYRLRPYIHNHPNLARYNNVEVKQCPNCLGTEFKEEGRIPAGRGIYLSLRCQTCGSLHGFGENLLTKDKRKMLLKA